MASMHSVTNRRTDDSIVPIADRSTIGYKLKVIQVFWDK